MEDNFLTSKEVCEKYKIAQQTILNWRRGYYFSNYKRIYYLPDHQGVPHVFDKRIRMCKYDPIKVAVWVNKVMKRREGEL